MRFTVAASVAGLAAMASAMHNVTAPVYQPASYVTEVVTAYTTYCPSATKITHGASTYTVTEATTLTITDCPCTITKPVYTSVMTTSCPTTAPVYTSAPAPYYPPGNATIAPIYTTPAGTGAYTAPPASYTGAANKASFGVAGLLAAAGLVAAL